MEKNNISVERHPLEPFLPENGRVLMLGSFPPQRKRWCVEFYSPNFTNDMWRVMGLVFYGNALRFVDVERKTYRLEDIVAFLKEKGIGLFDTASAVRRLKDNASDKDLEVVTPTDVEALLRRMPLCRTIVTTGQKATETICQRYGVEMPKVGSFSAFELHGEQFRLYRMPSTSRAYPLALAKKAEAYKQMFSLEIG
mgnify:CR=1 FL=1